MCHQHRYLSSGKGDLTEAFGDLELSGFSLWQYIKDSLATSSVRYSNYKKLECFQTSLSCYLGRPKIVNCQVTREYQNLQMICIFSKLKMTWISIKIINRKQFSVPVTTFILQCRTKIFKEN